MMNPTANVTRQTGHATFVAPPTDGIADRDLRIEIFAVCDGATEQDGRLSLLGTYELLKAASFPFTLPQATLVLRLRFWPAELREHQVRLAMTGPDGQPVGQPLEGKVILQPARADRSTAYNVIAQLHQLPIEQPGEYTFDFYLDGRVEGRLPICVLRHAAPETRDCREVVR